MGTLIRLAIAIAAASVVVLAFIGLMNLFYRLLVAP